MYICIHWLLLEFSKISLCIHCTCAVIDWRSCWSFLFCGPNSAHAKYSNRVNALWFKKLLNLWIHVKQSNVAVLQATSICWSIFIPAEREAVSVGLSFGKHSLCMYIWVVWSLGGWDGLHAYVMGYSLYITIVIFLWNFWDVSSL